MRDPAPVRSLNRARLRVDGFDAGAVSLTCFRGEASQPRAFASSPWVPRLPPFAILMIPGFFATLAFQQKGNRPILDMGGTMPLRGCLMLLFVGLFLGGVAGKPREGQQHLEELAYVVSGTINDFNPSALPGGLWISHLPGQTSPSTLSLKPSLPAHTSPRRTTRRPRSQKATSICLEYRLAHPPFPPSQIPSACPPSTNPQASSTTSRDAGAATKTWFARWLRARRATHHVTPASQRSWHLMTATGMIPSRRSSGSLLILHRPLLLPALSSRPGPGLGHHLHPFIPPLTFARSADKQGIRMQ